MILWYILELTIILSRLILVCSFLSRMIGKLARIIKTKKHPEASLCKRHRLNIAAAHLSTLDVHAEGEEDDVEYIAHPILNSAALNSFTDATHIVWPQPTDYTKRMASENQYRYNRPREHVLYRVLGKTVCHLYAARSDLDSAFVMLHLLTRVQIGAQKFNCKAREDGKMTEKTRESWFWMYAGDVPAFVEEHGRERDYRPNNILYGRINHWTQLTIQKWREKPFLLAEVTLFQQVEEVELPECTRLPYFFLDKPISFTVRVDVEPQAAPAAAAAVHINPPVTVTKCYIQVQHIRGMVAIAPRNENAGLHSFSFYVLPL